MNIVVSDDSYIDQEQSFEGNSLKVLCTRFPLAGIE